MGLGRRIERKVREGRSGKPPLLEELKKMLDEVKITVSNIDSRLKKVEDKIKP